MDKSIIRGIEVFSTPYLAFKSEVVEALYECSKRVHIDLNNIRVINDRRCHFSIKI